MDGHKWPKNQQFTDYVRGECLRQISTMDATASSLSTKASLYMVFAAFVFGVEVQFAHSANWRPSSSLCGVAMVLCLLSVLFLLRSASLREWRMPPRASAFSEQSADRFSEMVGHGKSEEDAMLVLQQKYVNSLSRSVDNNHEANMNTVKMMGRASKLLFASIILLLASAVLAFAPAFWRAVHL